MKILQLIYESFNSPFGFGGAGVRAYEIYKRLKDRHDITLACMKYPGARDCEVDGLRHIFLGAESSSLTKSVLAYTLKTALFVKRFGDDFDIIIENFLPSTPFFSGFLTRTPVILQVQGIMEAHSLKKFNPFYSVPMYLAERFYPRLYDRFIFVSDVTKEKVMARMDGRPAICRVIPNGVSKELLGATSWEGDYILFLSRIDIYTKGLDVLLKAFEIISPEFPEIRLVLAGYEFDRFDELVSGCGPALKKKISYAGFVKGNDKVRLLSGSRLFVLPSRHESSPVSVLEAAACGKPVVASDIAEMEFIQGQGIGLSFASGSAEALAGKMRLILADEGLRRAAGMKAREFAGRFLWDDIAVQFEDELTASAGTC